MLDKDNDALRAFGPALIALGLLIVVAAFFAHDLGVGGAPGFDRREMIFLGLGIAVTCAGAALLSSRLRAGVQSRLEAAFGSAPALRAGQVLMIAAWFGIVSGIVEIIYETVLKYGFGFLLKLSEHVIWITPASYFVLFVVIGLLLLPLGRVWSKGLPLPVIAVPLATLAAWGPFCTQPWLAWWTLVLICAGVGFQIARVATRRADGFVRLARRSLPWLIVLVVLAGIAIPTAKTVSESMIRAGLPDARQDTPNVLLIVLDTTRADHIGFCGYERDTTPFLDDLAEQSVVFEWAYSTSPWTLPSHSTMFTGRYRHEIEAEWLRALGDEDPTLAEVFTDQGYATAGFVGNVVYCLRENGIARGFSHYEDFLVKPTTLLTGSAIGRLVGQKVMGPRNLELNRNNAGEITDNFLSWLSGVEEERPFFAFLNYFDPHAPYIPPPKYATWFGPQASFVVDRFGWREYTDEEIAAFIDAYDANLVYVDAQLRRLFDRLREGGHLDNTIVIVTGDHGEHFGEHSLMDHGNSLYAPLLHIPLLVWFPPALKNPQRIADPVTLRDLGATILELTEVETNPQFPGQSLSRYFTPSSDAVGDPSPVLSAANRGIRTPPHEPISRGDMASLVEQQWHLILNGDGVLELYDGHADPLAERDLSKEPAHAERVKRMRERIRELMGR